MFDQAPVVPKGRLELPQPYGYYALNVARLPIPPLRLAGSIIRDWAPNVKHVETQLRADFPCGSPQ